ncbi:hypothetical protein E2C01_000514 [Portunus trituberculatus]|uniref:Uncharacterized protein n=1 Tax=Portunus trituberculatus TaxID=210409 RepID=A0A5B7CHN2_PORTR|nr:hypothetical protein [Portunus trituberculatus]
MTIFYKNFSKRLRQLSTAIHGEEEWSGPITAQAGEEGSGALQSLPAPGPFSNHANGFRHKVDEVVGQLPGAKEVHEGFVKLLWVTIILVAKLKELHEKAFLHQRDSRGGENIAAGTRHHQQAAIVSSTPGQHPGNALEFHILLMNYLGFVQLETFPVLWPPLHLVLCPEAYPALHPEVWLVECLVCPSAVCSHHHCLLLGQLAQLEQLKQALIGKQHCHIVEVCHKEARQHHHASQD